MAVRKKDEDDSLLVVKKSVDAEKKKGTTNGTAKTTKQTTATASSRSSGATHGGSSGKFGNGTADVQNKKYVADLADIKSDVAFAQRLGGTLDVPQGGVVIDTTAQREALASRRRSYEAEKQANEKTLQSYQGTLERLAGRLGDAYLNLDTGSDSYQRDREQMTQLNNKIRALQKQNAELDKKISSTVSEIRLQKLLNGRQADTFEKLYQLQQAQQTQATKLISGARVDMTLGEQVKKLRTALRKNGYTDDDIDGGLKAYTSYRNLQEAAKREEQTKEWMGKSGVNRLAANVAATVSAPVRSIGSVMKLLDGDAYSPYDVLGQFAQTVRGETQAHIQERITKETGSKALAKASTMLYNGMTSAVESLVTLKSGGKLGELLMSLNAAGSAFTEGVDRGMSTGQALATAAAAGTFEAVFEHLSLEKLRALQATPINPSSSLSRQVLTGIKNTMLQFVTEGSEEVATDIANELYDFAVNGGYSKYRTAIAGAKDQAAAKKQYWTDFGRQLGESFAVGGISGGLSAGTVQTAAGLQNLSENRRIGGAVQQYAAGQTGGLVGFVQRLQENIAPDSAAAQRLAGITENSGKARIGAAVRGYAAQAGAESAQGYRDLQGLSQSYELIRTAEDAAEDLTPHLTRIGLTDDEAEIAKTGLRKLAAGERLTHREEAMLDAQDGIVTQVYLETVARETQRQQDRIALLDNVLDAAENAGEKSWRDKLGGILHGRKNKTTEATPAKAEAETVNIRSAESARLAANARPAATTDAVYKNVQTLVETNRKTGESEKNVQTFFPARTRDGGKTTVFGVKGVENGSLLLEIDKETGAAEKLENLTFSGQTARDATQVFETLQTLMTPQGQFDTALSKDSANAALAFLSQTPDVRAEDFLEEWHEYYALGKGGTNITIRDDAVSYDPEKRRDVYAADIKRQSEHVMPAYLRAQAYDSGVREAEAKPGVTRVGTETLDDGTVAELMALDTVAKKRGVGIVVTDSLYSDGGNRYADLYGLDTGKNILVSLYTVEPDANGRRARQKNLLSVAAGHELTHWLKRQGEIGAENYDLLENMVLGSLQNSLSAEDYRALFDERREAYGDDESLIREEITAQYLGTVTTQANNEVLRKSVQENPGFWQKVLDHIKAFITDVKEALTGYAKRDKTVAAAMADDVERATFIADAFERAIRQVSETQQNTSAADAEVKFLYAGTRSKAKDESMLQTAEQMEKDGAESEAIRQETGWFRGMDHKWRYEISDEKFVTDLTGSLIDPKIKAFNSLEKKLLEGNASEDEVRKLREMTEEVKNIRRKPQKLGELVEHAALFDAYPQLKDLNIAFVASADGSGGAYNSNLNGIRIDPSLLNNKNKLRRTLIHEIQHAVQDIEGMSSGSSPAYWAQTLDPEKLKTDAEKEISRLLAQAGKDAENRYLRMRELDYAMEHPAYWNMDKLDDYEKESDEIYKELYPNAWFRRVLDLQRIADGSSSVYNEYYNRTAGEIEARDTEQRIDLTETERKEKRPDIDRTDVVFSDKAHIGWCMGVDQSVVDEYVDNAKTKSNTKAFIKYAEASGRLVSELKNEIDLSGYTHALRDNDIRHIFNSHGESTKEKYPVTGQDIKDIPKIVDEYDKVYYKTNKSGDPGLLYVKVGSDNTVYYVEGVYSKYGNEDLLLNKQMVKSGFDSIPKLYYDIITKNQSETEFLADLDKIRKAYVQDDSQYLSDNQNISQNNDKSQEEKHSRSLNAEEKKKGHLTEAVNPAEIEPVNEVTDRGKYDFLVEQFRKNGWNGRPVVLIKTGKNGYVALTGSHRILAAKEAGIDVESLVIPYEPGLDELISLYDDEQRAAEAKRLAKNGELSLYAAELISRESDLNDENYGVPFEKQVRWSRSLNAEAEEALAAAAAGDERIATAQDVLRRTAAATMRLARSSDEQLRLLVPKLGDLKKITDDFNFAEENGKEFAATVQKMVRNLLGGQVSFAGFLRDLTRVMQNQIENAGHWEDLNDASVTQFKQENRNKGIYLSPDIFATVAESYGGRQALRRATFGKINLTDDSSKGYEALDVYYDALLQENYGFLPTTDPGTQIAEILRHFAISERVWVDDAKHLDWVGDTAREIARDKSMELLGRILAIIPDGQDKGSLAGVTALRETLRAERAEAVRQAVDDAYAETEKKLTREQEQMLHDDNADTVSAEAWAEAQRTIRRQTARIEAIKNEADARLKRAARDAQREKESEQLRGQIKRQVKRLNRLLIRNENSENIPDALKGTVMGLLRLFANDRGIYTAKELDEIKFAYDLIARRIENGEKGYTQYEALDRLDADAMEALNVMVDTLKERRELTFQAPRPYRGEEATHHAARVEALKRMYADTDQIYVRDLTRGELEIVSNAVETINNYVKTAGEVIVGDRSEKANQMAASLMDECAEKKQRKVRGAGAELLGDFLKTYMLTPTYFFNEKIGGTMRELFEPFVDAQDDWARRATAGKDAIAAAKEKYNYKDWKKDEQTFTFTGYAADTDETWTVKLPVEARLQLYALMQRERKSGQESSHLLTRTSVNMNGEEEYFTGGVVLSDALLQEQKKLAAKKQQANAQLHDHQNEEYKAFLREVDERNKVVVDKEAHRLNAEDLRLIEDSLTAEQKAYADEIVRFMSTETSRWGNETTLKQYGIKKFGEGYYFPFETPQQFTSRRFGLADDTRLKNWGSAKNTVRNAYTPLVISGFSEVAANHIQEMALYSSFLIPIETMQTVYNAGDKHATANVKTALEGAYGKSAEKYINDFLTAVNGGLRSDSMDNIFNKMTGKFKSAAVMANASVVIQQPTALMRAMAVMNPKYFLGAARFADYKDMLAHCPTAVVKEMGGFDTAMGVSAAEWMLDEKSAADQARDFAGKGAEWADAATWTNIWNAVKRETRAKHKDVTYGSDDFYDICNRRFREIANYTQVYDSTLTKSMLMRSKAGLVKMATAFMAEPTLSYNLLVMSGKNKKITKSRAITAFLINTIVNTAAQSIVGAWRDRDEDQTYREKWLERFVGNLIGSKDIAFLDGAWSPLGLIPWVKDIISIFQGYDVERSDVSVFSDLIKSGQKIVKTIREGEAPTWEQYAEFLANASSFSPVPLKNVYKDVSRLYGTVRVRIDHDYIDTGYTAADSILTGLGFEQSDAEKAYFAILHGEEEVIKRMRGYGNAEIQKQMEKGYNFEDAEIMAAQAAYNKWHGNIVSGLVACDGRVLEAAQAKMTLDYEAYKKAAESMIADGFDETDVVSAIDRMIGSLTEKKAKTKAPAEKTLFENADIDAPVSADNKPAFDKLRTQLTTNGVESEKIESRAKSVIKDLYMENEIGFEDAVSRLTKYAGYDADAANSTVQVWQFQGLHPNTKLEDGSIRKYLAEIAPTGISAEVYEDYYEKQKNAKGTDLNGDGKTDSGSKKKEVLQIIDSLPISNAQKDALYNLNGWSARTIGEAPWH